MYRLTHYGNRQGQFSPVIGTLPKIGETLPPEARYHLQRLGHWERFQTEQHLPCPGVVSVWGHPAPVEKDFIFNPYGHGWQLDRAQFESGLLTATVEAGGSVQFDVCVDKIERQAAGWTVHTSTGCLVAHWLVDCTGRRGTVVRRAGGRYAQIDQLVAVFAIAATAHRTDCDARTYVESHPDGWCYTALMPNGTRMVAFQTDSDLLPQESPTTAWLWERIAACSVIRRASQPARLSVDRRAARGACALWPFPALRRRALDCRRRCRHDVRSTLWSRLGEGTEVRVTRR